MKSGWVNAKLGEVCSFLNRGISPSYLEHGGICVLNQKCVRDHKVSFQFSRRHDAQKKKVSEDRLVRAGDVLVNSTGTGTLGRVAQLRENPPEPTTVDSHITIARPLGGRFFLPFFGRMLEVIEEDIKAAGAGCGGQTELARSVLAESFNVWYPESLSEQQRIVDILDEAFEGIATARANAEQNLKNARAIFESHLQSIFSEVGSGREEHALSDLIAIQNGYAFKSAEYADAGYFVIRISNVQDGEITLDNPRFIRLADKKLERFVLNAGDILVSLTGNIGRVGILQKKHLPAVLNQRVARITERDERVERDFLFRFLSSRSFRLRLQDAGHGAAQQNVSTTEIEAVRIMLPSRSEQRRIAQEFEMFSDETARLGELYERKLDALDALKRSLLHQAFSGQL